MARLPYADFDTLPDDVRQCVDRLPARLNVFLMAAHAPTAVIPMVELGISLLSTLTVPPKLRELVILRVGRRSGAGYEWIQHLPSAQAAGASQAEIEAVARGDFASFSPAESAALALADRLARGEPTSDEQIAELTKFFTIRQTVELIVLAGYYIMLAKILTTLDVDVDPRGEALAETFVKAPTP